jgi:Outer membrane protein/protective antigen OMA87
VAPMGLFRFSYAIPMNSIDGRDRFYSDEIERFQFTVGGAF